MRRSKQTKFVRTFPLQSSQTKSFTLSVQPKCQIQVQSSGLGALEILVC
ncbi:hypothetical protein SLEP1_g23720 [Rubroshorea leprosula]|uniref:Uncharacterized protein n=1 Tax=Rubroshorea leprosula TaxID=152421 RepID=A0AAV5JMG3_9ROSI|nr:hypothetical protein SLEP1_g23720 [Rubroshorea leprosula]